MNTFQSSNNDSNSIEALGAKRLSALVNAHNVDVDFDDASALQYLLAMSDFIFRMCGRYQFIFEDLAASCVAKEAQLVLPQWSISETEWLSLSEADALKALRDFRHHLMVVIASQHFLKQIDIKTSMRYLSESADLFYVLARQWAECHLAPRWGKAINECGQPVPLIALGMGKLGGYELNFSSDIDLIFCYESKGTTAGGRKQEDFQTYFTKLAQKIIQLLDSVTPDGQVFRVDMRLRPFGDSGPLVSSFAALEDYYQEQGREWERYALLKARPLAYSKFITAEEQQSHTQLISMLKPFVYRRYIDFSVIESLRTMKRQIEQEVVRRNLVNNIKLGSGGIREAEFIVQALQMLRGGKEPQLQLPSFLSVLPELVRLNVFTEQEGINIEQSYLWLRDCEQYLQAFDDKQTQTLPSTELDQERLLTLFNVPTWDVFLTTVEAVSTQIHDIFDELIGESPEHQSSPNNKLVEKWQAIWQLDLQVDLQESTELEPSLQSSNDLSASAEHLTTKVAPNLTTEVTTNLTTNNLISCLMDQKADLIKAVLSSKGRDRLDLLIPHLMAECDAQKISVSQCADILKIIKRITARTTYLALLVEHPGALKQLVKLVSSCHFIGQELKHFPLLLDQLIDPKLLYTIPKLTDYAADLRRNLLRVDADDLELQMEILRQFKLSSQLIIAACDVSQIIDLPTVSNHLTALSEAILHQVVNLSWQQMVSRYGYPEGASDEDKNFAVLGYGKLGGYELGYGSDLDVVFVHGCASSSPTNGKKQIDSRQFYLKLAQRILHVFTTRTPSGILYELDTRLRPSGASGLLAININTFAEYQSTEAWTWEHQALVRARAVMGSRALTVQFEEIRKAILKSKRDTESLKADISKMREKMCANLSKETSELFDLKQSRGGIADIEFVTQFLVLQYSGEYAGLADYSDNKRLLEISSELGLITKAECNGLWEAYQEYRKLYHQQSLNLQEKLVGRSSIELHKNVVQQVWQRLSLK